MAPAEPFPVKLGIDVLADENFAPLVGKRVGLLTHAAGVNREGVRTADVLFHAPNVRLVALLAAEHGLDGTAPASEPMRDTVDPATRLPVYSLYGTTRPIKSLFAKFDVLVIDLQDIGSRSYTFVSAMRDALQAAFASGKEVVVLDRPNPLGGLLVDGPPIDLEWQSYVGAYPVPYVHGLTIGELARMALEVPGILKLSPDERAKANLLVVPMEGWKRSMRWPDTGLKFVPTSPYIQDYASAVGYAITGLGCQIGGFTHGIGHRYPFRGIAFPGKTTAELDQALSALHLPGIGFTVIKTTNDRGQPATGLYVEVTDWKTVRPTELSFHLMTLACAWDRTNPFAHATKAQMQSFNRHVGSTAWWQAIVRHGARTEVNRFIQEWQEADKRFQDWSRAFWLYPEPEATADETAGTSPAPAVSDQP